MNPTNKKRDIQDEECYIYNLCVNLQEINSCNQKEHITEKVIIKQKQKNTMNNIKK